MRFKVRGERNREWTGRGLSDLTIDEGKNGGVATDKNQEEEEEEQQQQQQQHSPKRKRLIEP